MKKRLILAAVGGLSLLAAASATQADTIVEATTSGIINPATSGGVNITFTGASLDTDTPISYPNAVQFGQFNVSGVSANTATFNSSFTLTITQTDPTADQGTIGGTVTGTVAYFQNKLLLTVTGGSLALSGNSNVSPITYTLLGGNIGNNIGSLTSFTAPVFGTIDFSMISVPTPASLAAGSLLLGGLFIMKKRAARRSA